MTTQVHPTRVSCSRPTSLSAGSSQLPAMSMLGLVPSPQIHDLPELYKSVAGYVRIGGQPAVSDAQVVALCHAREISGVQQPNCL